MQEVEAICDRAIIIKNGEIVADNQIEALQQGTSEVIIEIEFEKSIDINKLRLINTVNRIIDLGDNKFEIYSEENSDVRPQISQFAIDKNNLVLSMQKREQKMEDVFQNLTKD